MGGLVEQHFLKKAVAPVLSPLAGVNQEALVAPVAAE